MKELLRYLAFLAATLMTVSEVSACLINGSDPQLCETKEIMFNADSEANLVVSGKANSLASTVKIYEYLRNNAEYRAYHGSHSNSVNTLLSMRGNDVDLATTFIAMLRAKGIKSRFVEGDIKIKRAELTNWLGVANSDLAVFILLNQGVQNIDLSDPEHVIFQHVWVEALVNYDNYRAGNTVNPVLCTMVGNGCNWIALDVSFKQKKYKESYRTLLRNLGALEFNYTAYYNAEDPSTPDYIDNQKNKKPLEIFEEQALEYLRVNHPGVTLEDVIDSGEIITDTSGLLPASLPYEVVGAISYYDTIALHDAVNTVRWSKYITSNLYLGNCKTVNMIPDGVVTLADLSTKKLTLNVQVVNGQSLLVNRLEGEVVGNADVRAEGAVLPCDDPANTFVIENGTSMKANLYVDTVPGSDPINVIYDDLIVGGYYLIATGDETSNWSQVKRSYQQLLAYNDAYPIVTDSNGIAYVDMNLDGLYDAGDIALQDHFTAQDRLIGGLLHVAQRIYYARLRDESERYSRLRGMVSPILTYLGIVSTQSEVGYLDNLPFAVMPKGLLIDLKGLYTLGSYLLDQPPTAYSNDTFRFIGHIGSSLEHEIWQEITGFDAISTVRGIQKALAGDSGDVELIKFDSYETNYQNGPINTAITFSSFNLAKFGFKNTAPGFSKQEYDLFGRRLTTWKPVADNDGFYIFKPNITGIPTDAFERQIIAFSSDNGIDGFISGYDGLENTLLDAIASSGQPFFTTLNYSVTFPPDAYSTGATLTAKGLSDGKTYTNFSVLGGFSGLLGFGGGSGTLSLSAPAGIPAQTYRLTLVFPYQRMVQQPGHWQTSPQTCFYDPYSGTRCIPGISIYIPGPFVRQQGSVTQTVDINIGNNSLTWTCSANGQIYTAQPAQMLIHVENCFNSIIDANTNTTSNLRGLIDFLDVNKGFNSSNYLYRLKTPAFDEVHIGYIKQIRDDMYNLDPGVKNAYLIPNKYPKGESFVFNVYLKDTYNYARLNSSVYAIANHSDLLTAGGGYVTALDPITPSLDFLNFNNDTFSDSNFDLTINNDFTLTPSTWDPVSTVTGNMFHDETDIIIKGKGLDYIFTRTSNSLDVGEASNFPISKGWTHSYNMKLVANEHGENPDFDAVQAPENYDGKVSSITYTNERGGEANFLVFDPTWNPYGLDYTYDPAKISQECNNVPGFCPGPPNWVFRSYPINADLSVNAFYDNGALVLLREQVFSADMTTWPIHQVEALETSPPKMNFDKLELDVPITGQYTLTFRNGTKYIFSGGDLEVPGNTARLLMIENPYGQQLNFGYSGNNLTSITDNLGITGRTGLLLSYNTIGINTGRLDKITDWTGRVWEYTYNINGQLESVIDPLNNATSYTYHQGTDKVKYIISPEVRDGGVKATGFSYYEDDRAYSYIDQLGNEESLTYDLFRKRTRITNPRGFITEHFYDKNGALIKLVEPDNGILQFENNDDGLRYLKRDALGYTTTYAYNTARTLDGALSDSFGQVTREKDALGNTIDYSYGIYDQVINIKDKNNNHLLKVYYAVTDVATGAVKGKLQRIVLPQMTVNGAAQVNVNLAEYKYYADGTVKRVEEIIDPATPARKRITDFVYSFLSTGFTVTKTVTGATSGDTIVTQQVYDSLWRPKSTTINRRTSATDLTMLALTTSYEYDKLSRPIKITDPLGNITENIYDKNGKVSQIINRYALSGTNNSSIHENCTIDPLYPNHHSCIVVANTYDKIDRLKTKTDISGAITKYQYDESNNITKITNALGHSLANEYDANNRLTKVTNQNGYSAQTNYDLTGRITSTIDGNGNATKFEYDALGRLIKTMSAENRISTIDQYDGNGNIIKARDANAVAGIQPVNTQGASVYKIYDEFNRVISEMNADNETTNYTYDLLGNLTSVTDALNQTTSFVYDDLGRLIETIDPIVETPIDKTVTYTYDEVGNRLTMTDRLGKNTRTTYDAVNRAILVEYLTDGASQSVSYDQYGDKVGVSNSDVTYTYTYNNRHLMTAKTDSRNNKSLIWSYDAVGNLISKTDYQGKVTTFTYDDTNRLVAMKNPAYLQASYHYDAAGRLLSRILSNGVSTIYNYDNDGYLTKITQRSADGTIIDDRAFGHDDVGNITSVTTAAETIIYNYDPDYRLLGANSTIDTKDLVWTYDDVGNRQTMTQGGLTYYYNHSSNGNRLNDIRTGGVTGPIVNSFDYDDNGSRIAKRDSAGNIIENYIFDQRRFITKINSGGNTSTFTYDPNAYRISKNTATGSSNYLLEGEHLEATYDDSNQLKASYLRGVVVDEIINGLEKDANGKLINRSYHHDQVNSVVATSDHTGAATQATTYGPFGQSLNTTGTDSNRLMYTGRENDGSGLYYYRARYYDPLAGRFLSEDPIGFKGGTNFYAYVKNNPLRFNDPSGNIPPAFIQHVFPEGITATFGFSGNIPLTGVGGSFGVAVSTKGQVGGFVEFAPSPNMPIQSAINSIDPGNVLSEMSGGLDFHRFTVDFGLQIGNVSDMAGFNTSGFAGLGLEGITVSDNGFSLNLGPQVRIGVETTATAVGGFDFSTFDFFTGGFNADQNTTSINGGFEYYPSDININFLSDVYSK